MAFVLALTTIDTSRPEGSAAIRATSKPITKKSVTPSPSMSIAMSHSNAAAFEQRGYVLTANTRELLDPDGKACTPTARVST